MWPAVREANAKKLASETIYTRIKPLKSILQEAVRKGYLEQNSMNLLPVNMANEVLNSSISISRLTSNQYQKSGYKFLQNWLIKTSASNVSLLYAPISWSTHAQQVLCKRTTAVVRPTELTSPITYTIFSDNFFRILRLYLTLACIYWSCSCVVKRFLVCPYSIKIGWAIMWWLSLNSCMLGMSLF